MNLEGYESDEGSLDGSELPESPKGEASGVFETENRPTVVVTSNVQNTFGGVVQKAIPVPKIGRKRHFERSKTNSKTKKQKNDPEQLEFCGPWGGPSSSDEDDYDQNEVSENEPEVQEQGSPQSYKRQEGEEGGNHDEPKSEISTELYTDQDFMTPKSGYKASNPMKSTVPKKMNFALSGHSKGVTRLRFFPKSGHLLLSCGNDGKIFLWNLDGENRRKVRGYFGHIKAVKDVVFTSGGDTFLSCSYDNTIILWKTETGDILKRIKLSATPNCAIFNPNNENEIVVGLENKRIEHYDLASPNTPIQIYDHHLGAINSLTVVNADSVFMSTSDDRTIRFWKWNINIPTKIIADHTQHSTPSAAAHPLESFIALQSMDDSIYVIQAGGKYRYKKKSFTGHKVAGYGIDIDFSSDGSYLMSGDINGHVFIWSWKRCQVLQKIKLSGGVISCLSAHPFKPNVFAAAGRKGEIYICN